MTKTISSRLSNLVNNLLEGIHKIKRKYKHDDKNCETRELNTKNSNVLLNA